MSGRQRAALALLPIAGLGLALGSFLLCDDAEQTASLQARATRGERASARPPTAAVDAVGAPRVLPVDEGAAAARRAASSTPSAARRRGSTGSRGVARPARVALRGKVVDPWSRPVANARVVVVGRDDRRQETRTDRRGAFAFGAGSAPFVAVLAEARSHARTARPLRPGERTVVVTMPLGGGVRFRLEPAPKGTVLVGAVLDDGQLGGMAAATLGKDGTFLADQLPTRTNALVVAGAVTPFRVDAVRVAAGQVRDLGTLQPRHAQPVAGRVVDGQGRSLAGVHVTARSLEPTRPLHQLLFRTRTGLTRAQGRFRLGGLPPGRYRLEAVRVRPPGIARATVVVPEGGAALPVTIRFQTPGTLEGRVRCDRRSTAGLVVRVQQPSLTRLVRTRKDGSFAFDRLPPGAYDVAVYDRSGRQLFFGRHRVRAGESQPLTCVLKG